MEAIGQVRAVAGEKCFVSGLSAIVTDTKQLVEDQEAIYVAIAVALCALVLGGRSHLRVSAFLAEHMAAAKLITAAAMFVLILIAWLL